MDSRLGIVLHRFPLSSVIHIESILLVVHCADFILHVLLYYFLRLKLIFPFPSGNITNVPNLGIEINL